ncbi:MAG: acetylornithine deacetylase, partial [Gammaproteobacteria bacterium]
MNNTVAILERLVSFPTVSRNSNLDLIEFTADYLDGLGVTCDLVHNEDRSKANMYATIGPDDVPGVMLSGHSDVVPVDGQPWTRDAFKPDITDDRIYGRGTTDMKGYLAAVLALAPQAASRQLKKPIHIAFSYDEEIGCVGVRGLINAMQSFEVRPQFCVIGEPTQMTTAIAHKGKTAATCRCKGVAAHSALTPSGLNAIYLAQDMISEIRSLQKKIIKNSSHDPAYDV